MAGNFKEKGKQSSAEKLISLKPLDLDEAVSDLLKVKPEAKKDSKANIGNKAEEPTIYSIEEAAEKLGLSLGHVRLLAKRGAMNAKKQGRKWVVFDLTCRRRKAGRGHAEMPEVGKILKGRTHGKDVFAEVVSLEDGGAGILFNGNIYRSMSAAAVAATGNSTDGWLFWKST